MNTNRALTTIKEEIELALQDTALLYDDGKWCAYVDTHSEYVVEVHRLKESSLTPVHWTA